MALRSREKVEKYIYRTLASLKGGERLPSLRMIMDDCGVSQLTVQNVLKDYEENNQIKSSNRRGFFKLDEPELPATFDQLDLIYCPQAVNIDPTLQFHGSFSHHVGRYCGEKWRSVRMHFMEGVIDTSALKQIAESRKCQACIIIAPPHPEMGEAFRKNHVPYVNLFSNSPQLDPYAPNIIIDNDRVTELQMEHLLELGHRKIAYLHLVRPNEIIRDLNMRRESFFKYAMSHELRINPEWVRFGGYTSEEAMEAMNAILALDDRPTSIIVEDHHLPAVYRSLEQQGFAPGKDFSVVGTNNQSISQVVYPSATSIDMAQDRAARLALKALEKTIEDASYTETILLEPKLICRNSTNESYN